MNTQPALPYKYARVEAAEAIASKNKEYTTLPEKVRAHTAMLKSSLNSFH